MMRSGIYQIKNQINGHRYIGSAVNLRNRWLGHLSGLRRQRHRNRHLQAAFKKYGEDAFVFSVLEYVRELGKLIECEQHYLDALHPEYNIESVAGSSLGVRRTEETRRKMTASRMGHQTTAETRRKISESLSGARHPMYGKHHSLEA